MAVSVNWGSIPGCPYNKIPTVLGFVFGPLIFGNCLLAAQGISHLL